MSEGAEIPEKKVNAGRFKPGQSGNPYGRTKRFWINEKKRLREARKSFDKLVEIRDAKIYQRTFEVVDGVVKEVDVVPSVKEVRESCKAIMAYTVGLPVQQVEHIGESTRPFSVPVLLQVNNNPAGESFAIAFNGNGVKHEPDNNGAGDQSVHTGNGNGQS
jgi:hypothetical protein